LLNKPQSHLSLNWEDLLANPDFTDVNGPRGPFHATLGLIGKALGTPNIGINITVVPAGKKAWPRHYHYCNDELFIVLSGKGTLHYGDGHYPIRTGDVISIEAGTGIPFQFENTSEDELKYLALSTLKHPDLFIYPDSNKIGVMAGGGPMREAAPGRQKLIRFIRKDMNVGYWEGEVDE
jgi:uncharacterized cupin superfamily protein